FLSWRSFFCGSSSCFFRRLCFCGRFSGIGFHSCYLSLCGSAFSRSRCSCGFSTCLTSCCRWFFHVFSHGLSHLGSFLCSCSNLSGSDLNSCLVDRTHH